MVQQILQWLSEIGLPGLFLTMMIEGSSIPFLGIVIVIPYGYVLPFSFWGTAMIAAGMSLAYTAASLIPYALGYKLERIASGRLKKGIQKAQTFFRRYGLWSIALTRPFGIGNYISYAAGLGKVKLWKYVLLTYFGIYPWSFAMLLLGHYFNGSVSAAENLFDTYDFYFYLAVVVVVLGGVIYFCIRAEKRAANKMEKREQGG